MKAKQGGVTTQLEGQGNADRHTMSLFCCLQPIFPDSLTGISYLFAAHHDYMDDLKAAFKE